MPATAEPSGAEAGAAPASLGRRYARAAAYSGVFGGVSQALYGLTPMIVARRLGPRDYGVYSVVMSLVAIVIGVFNMGQNSALHKLIPQYYAEDRARSGAILADVMILTAGLLAAFCAAFFLLSGRIAARIYQDAGLAEAFRVSALLMLTMALCGLAASSIAGLQDFKAHSQIQVTRNLALLIAVWVGTSLLSLRGALWGQVLANVFGLGLLSRRLLTLVRERFPEGLRPAFSRGELAAIGSFVLPTLLLTLLNLPAYWWTSTMVSRGAGFEQAGMFSVAYTMTQLTTLLPMTLYTPAMTFMSEAHAKSQGGVFTGLVSGNLRALWLFTLPLALGCAAFAPFLVRALFGEAYAGASPLAFAFSLTGLLMALTGLINTAIAAAGRAWGNCGITLGLAVFYVVAGLYVIPRRGAAGAAALFVAANVLYLVSVGLYSSAAMRVRYAGMGRLASLTAVSFLAAAVVLYASGARPCAGGLVAAAALWLCLVGAEWLWVCDGGERERFRRSAAKVLNRYRATR
jgi:O-antigen/teichoic acid export membrane protein